MGRRSPVAPGVEWHIKNGTAPAAPGANMKKAIISICCAALIFVGWITLRRFETWVVPAIDVIVTDRDGRPLAVGSRDVSVESDQLSDVTWAYEANGRVLIRPKKIRMRSSLGDTVFWTSITVEPKGYKACHVRVMISGGELDGSLPPPHYQVRFRLAEDGTDINSEVDTSWINPRGKNALTSDSSAKAGTK